MVMVTVGLMEEARTISRLSPVARRDNPILVPRNQMRKHPARQVITALTISEYQRPPIPKLRKRVKMVFCLRMLALEVQPIAIKFTV